MPPTQTYLSSVNSRIPYLRTFATDATFLDAAEWRDFGGDESGVEADDAVLQRFGDAPRAREVARVDIRREAEFGVVGEPHGFFVGVHAEQRRDRTEGFLARQNHVAADVRQHRGLVERAAERMALAAGGHLRALGLRIGDVLFDFGQRLGVDQRSLVGFALQAVADAQLLHRLGELLR